MAAGVTNNRVVDPLISHTAETLLNMAYKPWSFGDSVAFEALIEATDLTGDQRYIGYAHGFMRAWAASRGPIKELDVTAPGLAMVEVARRTEDAQLLEALVDLSAFLRLRPKHFGIYQTWASSPLRQPYGPLPLAPSEVRLLHDPPPGVFLDCLHFDPPFFVALGQLTGELELVEDGVDQALAYVALLQHDDGLFDHFAMHGVQGNFGPAWGRGQGWAVLGLLDVVERLDRGHPSFERLTGALTRLIHAMVVLQDDSGHWPSVVHRPDSVPEASTAAFMGYGFLRAHQLGLVGDQVRDAGLLAVRAAEESARGGYLVPVSAAVWACTQPEHYCHVPTGFIVPWGEGPLLLALGARYRFEEEGSRVD